jgi:cytosine/adenosine deaminase-related metal-dependent hydrolase
MDRTAGDQPVADVHVRDGIIVAVGPALAVAGIPSVDATDRIVMPGFVDTHSHLWNAFLRGSVRGDDPVQGYFPVTDRAAPLCTPEDVYRSVRFGAAQELLSGVTTVNNYSHNTRSPEHADAEIQALLDTGIRGRFSYGPAGRQGVINMRDLPRVQERWLQDNPRLTLGVNLQNPPPEILKSRGSFDQFVAEVAEARRLGLPISLHYGNTSQGLVDFLGTRRLLAPDLLFIHTQGFTADERRRLIDARVKFSMSPAIEIPYSTVRNGYIQFAELEELGAELSLSIDASSASANADFFGVMRALQWAHKQRADTKLSVPPRRIVEIATAGGARALGLERQVGSLVPGKRADIILARKSDPNIAPVFDPYYSLVYSGLPQNIDTVIVDGRILIRDGRFTSLDLGRVVQEATQSAVRIDEAMRR